MSTLPSRVQSLIDFYEGMTFEKLKKENRLKEKIIWSKLALWGVHFVLR